MKLWIEGSFETEASTDVIAMVCFIVTRVGMPSPLYSVNGRELAIHWNGILGVR